MHKYFSALLGLICFFYTAHANDTTLSAVRKSAGNPGLRLPAGFSAGIVADSLGKARHIVATKNGALYIKLSKLLNGKGILRVRDNNNDGRADEIKGFGNYIGTGITIKDGYLYTSSNEEVYRYKLDDEEEVINPESPEIIIKGLVNPLYWMIRAIFM
jgi:hypothetical protein